MKKNFSFFLIVCLVGSFIFTTGCTTQSLPSPVTTMTAVSTPNLTSESTTQPTTLLTPQSTEIPFTQLTTTPIIQPTTIPIEAQSDTVVTINGVEMNYSMGHPLNPDKQFVLFDICVKNLANPLGDRQYYGVMIRDANNSLYFQYPLGPVDEAFALGPIPLGETRCGKAAFIVPASHTTATQYTLMVQSNR